MLETDNQEVENLRADHARVDNQANDIPATNTPSASYCAASTAGFSTAIDTASPQTISALSPDSSLPETLSALSRNASVISTSSSDSGPTSLLLTTPRPRPARTFSAPRSQSPRSRSPHSSIPPSYLAQELGMSADSRTLTSSAKSRSKSRNRNAAATVDDFKFGALLGEGSYSTVKLATHIRTGHQYAIKVLEKAHLIKNEKTSTPLAEKNALVRLAGHPGIVRLHYTFQDEWRLYFVIDLARNGEMQSLISKLGSLSTKCTQYYAAQVVDALDYMHTKGVIHRDLKPENLLLDDDFRIKITDFGTGKILETGVERAETWVGTAQYIAPELLEAKETSRGSDFWALGCIIYQMIAGRFAFQGLSDFLTWQKIKQLEYTFPEGFNVQAQDLIQRLLVRDPARRLGVGLPGTGNDMLALRSHPFFASINWETLWTDPPPVLEPGLVKREQPPSMGHDQDWDDVGAAWDDLVGSGGSDRDDLEWASDGEAPGYELRSNSYFNITDTAILQDKADIGPLGEIRRPAPLRRDTETTVHTTTGNVREMGGASTGMRGSSLSGSPPSSSSEGSPDVARGIESKSISERSSTEQPHQTTLPGEERGRNQTMSPVQGNGTPDNYASILRLPETEVVLFTSAVEARSLRRRASRLIPLPVPSSKAKTRELILTSRRLICLKRQSKGPGGISIKSELALRASEKLKEKDKERESRGIVASVERKGEREFVVLTSSKAYGYAAKDSSLASTWTEQLKNALASNVQLSKARS